jgi:hypothetical protein
MFSSRVGFGSTLPTRRPDNPAELKHKNDQLIKKKLTKISKKCLELLYSMKICNFFPSVFGGLSGRFVGCRRVVGSARRQAVGLGSKFFVGFGFWSEKPTRSHHCFPRPQTQLDCPNHNELFFRCTLIARRRRSWLTCSLDVLIHSSSNRRLSSAVSPPPPPGTSSSTRRTRPARWKIL